MRTKSLFSLFIALIAVACGAGSATPSQVAEKFLTHTNKMEFKEAKEYSTKATGEMLDMVAGMAGMMGEQPPAPSFKITGETIEGETATVTYRTEGKDADESVSLIKEDGKWKVNMNKEDLDKEEGAGDMDMDMDGDMDWAADDTVNMEMDMETELEAVPAQ